MNDFININYEAGYAVMRNDYKAAVRVAELAIDILKSSRTPYKENMDFWKMIGVIAAEQSHAPENIILWWKELGGSDE